MRLFILSNSLTYFKGAMYLKSDGQMGSGFTWRLRVSPLCLTWGFSFTAKFVPTYFIFLFQAGKA